MGRRLIGSGAPDFEAQIHPGNCHGFGGMGTPAVRNAGNSATGTAAAGGNAQARGQPRVRRPDVPAAQPRPRG